MNLTCLLCDTLFSTTDYGTPQTAYLMCPPCREKAIAEARREINPKPPAKHKRKRTPKASRLLKKAFPKPSEYRKKQIAEIKRKSKRKVNV